MFIKPASDTSAPVQPAEIQPDALERAIALSARCLIAMARDDGSFVYRVNIDPSVKIKPRYNWLRHAGALYALADYHGQSGDARVPVLVERAISHMRETAQAPVNDMPGAVTIWADGEHPLLTEPRLAKLGAAGLALIASVALERMKPAAVPQDALTGYAAFILAMQKPDGSFYSKYMPDQGGKLDHWTSLYYPGEAALGLTELYEYDGGPQWLEGACRALRYLAQSRRGLSTVPADHWALIATKRLWPHLNDRDRSDFRDHARQIAGLILSEQVWHEGSPAHGGYAQDGRTTPTATRLEGLLAAEFLFREDADFHARVGVSISWGIAFLLQAQLRQGPWAGGFTRAVARILSDHPKAAAFNRRATELRIDYVQHALSAFLQYRQMARETS